MRKYSFTPEAQVPKGDYWSFDWWARKVDEADEQKRHAVGSGSRRGGTWAPYL
jgi:hypothetical protein